MKPLKFKISSALKNIIGKDLITDDFIAVFELVKNSYDAHASRVDISFEETNLGRGKITIKDNGKGMNYDDLISKWLFVAYSAKKEGTEEDNFDYRDSIYSGKPYAGAKGIGRFSCDRLGSKLYLETIKHEKNPQVEVLITDWEKFEGNLREEFVDINVQHYVKDKSDFGISHGTVLVIEDLRSEWGREKYLKLKQSLAKLINPNRGKDEHNFKVFLHVDDELKKDENINNDYDRVNGEIKNFIFEELELKTTKITSLISSEGNLVTTELNDGGTLIYKIKERNKFLLLPNVSITLYYLNMSAKQTFTRRMGLSSRLYGHVFMYKNGFRIYPFGEPGEDPLKIDTRKTQGYGRYLGTRDLIGQIEIHDNDERLKETTSRADGLIKSDAYYELEDYFWDTLKKLEKYVVEVQKWGLSIENDRWDLEENYTELLAQLSGSNDIIDFKTADNFLDTIEKSQSKSAEAVVKNLNRIALKSKNTELIKQTEKASKKLEEIQLARKRAEKEVEVVRKVATEFERDLEDKESENLFLKSVKSQDFDEIISFIHHIGISSSNVDNYLTGIYKKLSRGIVIEQSKLSEVIKYVLFENKKIQNITKFATKANFKLYTDAVEIDISEYIKEYINNVLLISSNYELKIKLVDNVNYFKIKLRPIELNILIDNLLSNSKKALASKFTIQLDKGEDSNELLLKFIDNGKGMTKDNIEKIFNIGYTTTKGGAGIGLHHVKEIIERMNGEIEVESKIDKGTQITIILK